MNANNGQYCSLNISLSSLDMAPMLVIEISLIINDILPKLQMLEPVHRIHAKKKNYIDRHLLQNKNIMIFFQVK